MPLWAKVYTQPITVSKAETLGATQLAPGNYQLTADSTKMQLLVVQNGKTIATVPGQWVKLPKKAQDSSTVTDSDKITQVQFAGADSAFQPQ